MKKTKKYLDKSGKVWLNIECHCVKALFWLKKATRFRKSSGYKHDPELKQT